nr:stem-specific protein TSJT1-like [Tanacetum cinerariifolium]
MLAVFGSTISNPPQELSLPFKGTGSLRTSEEVAGFFESGRVDSTWYKFPNGDFMALSHKDEYATCPRCIVVMDDIFCIFNGYLHNTCHLRRSYGLSKQANEAMVVVEAYKVLRDRAPYPADQVIKELDGKFSFVLFDAKATKLFIARDRDGSAQLHWGIAITGESFFTASAMATDLIKNNILRIGKVNVIGNVILFLGKLCVSLASALFAFLMLDTHAYKSAHNKVSSPLIPVLVCWGLGFVVATLFFAVVEVSIDTIILSYCQDSEEHRGTTQYATPLLLQPLDEQIEMDRHEQ